MKRTPPSRLALAGMALLAITLAGCTVNTYPDGSRETMWGVPQEEEGDQQRPGTYRDETGEIRGQTEVPER